MRASEFLTDWKSWKHDFDELMAYRKTIKGKPDHWQMAMIELHKPWIAFYRKVLWP